jgi:hypothetical protein
MAGASFPRRGKVLRKDGRGVGEQDPAAVDLASNLLRDPSSAPAGEGG